MSLAKEVGRRLGKAVRILATGQLSSVSDDEAVEFALRPLNPVNDGSLKGPRLNVLSPTLSAKNAFGGVATLVDLPMAVFKSALMHQGWTLRYVGLAGDPGAGDNIAEQCAKKHGIPWAAIEKCYVGEPTVPVPVGVGDVFLGSLWHSYFRALPLLRFQEQIAQGRRRPYVSLVQDYEPGFYPWSSAYMLVLANYDSTWPKRAIFNSRELAAFYAAQQHPVERSVVFEPVMNASLQKALETPSSIRKERRILFYGRPEHRRNCFFLGRRALEIWSQTFERAGDWQVISVGQEHHPIQLAKGARCRVLGTLSLDGYADELKKAAVGLSLMASPHPSYPPLEMAHFGALTVTNSFACKDLSTWHQNLVSIDVADPENIASALCDACQAFERDPTVGAKGVSLRPQYTAGYDQGVLDGIARLLIDD